MIDGRVARRQRNVDAVLDGDIFPFIEAYLKFKRQKGRDDGNGGQKKAVSQS